MTGHLPECPAPSEYGGGEYHIYDERPCICPALRSCEQRVRATLLPHRDCGEPVCTNCVSYNYGYEQALRAARDAVDGLDKYHHGQIDAADALAAIDALRGDDDEA